MPTTTHSTKTICPRCEVTFIKHVHCANVGCAFHIHVCDRCDREQTVNRFMTEHAQKDCKGTAPAVRAGAHGQLRVVRAA